MRLQTKYITLFNNKPDVLTTDLNLSRAAGRVVRFDSKLEQNVEANPSDMHGPRKTRNAFPIPISVSRKREKWRLQLHRTRISLCRSIDPRSGLPTDPKHTIMLQTRWLLCFPEACHISVQQERIVSRQHRSPLPTNTERFYFHFRFYVWTFRFSFSFNALDICVSLEKAMATNSSLWKK